MYPIKFVPIMKEMIWGSESWEITCRPHEMGVIENGEFAGKTFAELIATSPAKILGTALAEKASDKFPLLVKIIDARDALSVQVHPNDAYAKLKGAADTGKSELWYILEPPTDGHLIIGLKDGITREGLSQAYENGTVEACLNRVKVRRGDIVNIPAGLIHALTAGVVVAEIQQNSDITYRLYDFGRVGTDGKPRELHVQDALAVTNFSNETGEINHFSVQKMEITAPFQTASNPQVFSVYTAVENSAVIETPSHTVILPARRSVFIPAALGAFTITPQNQVVTLLSTHAYY
ncbi:MAG: hypothetical protein FWB96_04905 [Defluviitaleaceae bacterium]|nr:hypothetical protein [Defluviitaleaceae bacterium]MCL2262226.1 hypothetical protein [Defluviitaleaceae bacterium]